jgi:hypothetical protein
MFYCITSGKQTWYSGWKFEYTGFPMTQYKSYGNKDHVCVDKTAEPIDTDTFDKIGVRTTCDCFCRLSKIFANQMLFIGKQQSK